MGGLLFGYDMGIVAAALPSLADGWNLEHRPQEWIVAILYIGGGIGAGIGGSLCDSWGRKRTILVVDVLFVLGALVLAFAPTVSVVLLGRYIVGFAMAVAGLADVTYLHETAPPTQRGSIVSVHEGSIALGFLVAWTVGGIVAPMDDAWRIMFGLGGVGALVQFGGLLCLPESPAWLEQQGRMSEAHSARIRLGLVDPNEEEDKQDEKSTWTDLDAYSQNKTETSAQSYQHTHVKDNDGIKSSDIEMSENGEMDPPCLKTGTRAWYMLHQQACDLWNTLSDSRYRRQGYIALFLAMSQQLCGHTVVLSYAPYLLAAATGDDSVTATTYVDSWTTLSIGFVKFLVTCIVIACIERVGRRTLLLSGIAFIGSGLVSLIVALQFVSSETIALIGVLLVVTGYSMSFGPLTWLMTSELVPTEIRGRALGASTIVTYLMAALSTYTFLSFSDAAGMGAVFTCYLLLTLAGALFSYTAVPDTGGNLSATDLEASLSSLWLWKKEEIVKQQELPKDAVIT